MPISLTRTFDSFDSNSQSAWRRRYAAPYDVNPVGSRFPYTYIDLILEDGDSIHFERISKGTGYVDAVYEHRDTSSPEFFGARIHWNGDGWDLALPDGSTFVFPEACSAKTIAQAAITEIRSSSGQRIEVDRKRNGDIEKVTSSAGHQLDFSYDDSGRILEARDDIGNSREYSYDSAGRLVVISDGNANLYLFAYGRSFMTRILDGKGMNILAISYHAGRVAALWIGDGDPYRLTYDVDSQNTVVRTVVVAPDGTTKEFRFH